MERTSTYPMLGMEDALDIVRNYAQHVGSATIQMPLNNPKARVLLCCLFNLLSDDFLLQVVGLIVADDSVCARNIPPVSCSRLDGYAAQSAELQPSKQFVVCGHYRPGHVEVVQTLLPGTVAWVTTGAPIPANADTVVPVEYTSSVNNGGDTVGGAIPGSDVTVTIDRTVPSGNGIRPHASDFAEGDVLVAAGSALSIGMISLLLSAGITHVSVFRPPVVAVLSTGDELVNPFTAPPSTSDRQKSVSSVMDSNKTMLQQLICSTMSAEYVDCGAVPDMMEAAGVALVAACNHPTNPQIIVTTGGVSMGDRDYIKPVLATLGEVHFGRLRMKPGKPATFATIAAERGPILVFALPGNPVSAWVCFHVLIAPCIKVLAGAAWQDALPPRIPVQMLDAVPHDSERPEFHRSLVYLDPVTGTLQARSTGAQDSSRLASTVDANALVWVPQSAHPWTAPFSATAYMIAPLHVSALPDWVVTRKPLTEASSLGCGCGRSQSPAATHHSTAAPGLAVRACVLTVSTRCSKGESVDKSGPKIVDLLASHPKLSTQLISSAVVADDEAAIKAAISLWLSRPEPPTLIVSTGGTGFSCTDVTPEAIQPLLWKRCPGLVHAMLTYSCSKTPLAALSRYDAGIIKSTAAPGGTLVIELPGSVKAVSECLEALAGVLPHALQLLQSPV
jgi:gephyrin